MNPSIEDKNEISLINKGKVKNDLNIFISYVAFYV
jgi:hypothetical protein